VTDLSITEARRLARAQRHVADAARTGNREQIEQAQAELDTVRHDLYEGDDEE
jgi:hypothetical protein